MKILITGGCGFLGSNIAASSLESGRQVFVVDALLRQGGDQNKQWLLSEANRLGVAEPTIAHFDLADAEAVNAFFATHAPFDFVAHLAGQVAMTTSMADPRRDFQTNAVGTFNVLEATRRYSPDAVLTYSSTNKVYGELEQYPLEENKTRYRVPSQPNGFSETVPLDFSSPYGCSKGCADQYVRDWHRNFGLNTVVFRHSSIYGGRQFSSFDQGWVGWFCLQAATQKKARESGQAVKPFTIAGNGKQVRDVLHADDLIQLYEAAFRQGKTCPGTVFNIGGGMENSLSLVELFALLEEFTGQPLHYEQTPWRHSDQKVFVADISRAKSLLDWSPTVSVRKGVQRQLQWVENI